MPRKGTYPAYERIAREASDADEVNVNCFENRSPHPEKPESQELDQEQLKSFELVVNQWLSQQHGQERKAKAVVWFSEMLSRLRKRIGTDEKTINQSEELDRIGMAIVSDSVVTVDGHASVGFERLAPSLGRLCFEGQENVKIVCTDELKPSKLDLKVNTNAGEIACRELVFRDAVTQKIETRRYALVDGDVHRVRSGRILPQWLSWKENYALKLIRTILSEVSK